MDVVKSCLSHGKRKLLDDVIGDIEEAGDVVSSALIKKQEQSWAFRRAFIRQRS